MKWVIGVIYLFRMADDMQHSDTVGLRSYKRRLDVNLVYIYPHTSSKGKGSFILSHTFKIFILKHESLPWLDDKGTMSFVSTQPEVWNELGMLVLLQLKSCVTSNLLTYIEYWNSFLSLHLWGKRPMTSTTTTVIHSWFLKSCSTLNNNYYCRNARTLTHTVKNRNFFSLYNFTRLNTKYSTGTHKDSNTFSYFFPCIKQHSLAFI